MAERIVNSCVATLLLLSYGNARADNFVNVRYDATRDQLVLTMAYRGTNADHHFSLKWGTCQDARADGLHPIVAEVLDDQWQDSAERDFKKTSRISLAIMSCRPALLTLRTAPRFYYTLQIPGRP
jgi:hypothetical protein